MPIPKKIRRMRAWCWQHEVESSALACIALACIIVLGVSCGDDAVVPMTPVEMCGPPPPLPKMFFWFEFGDDGSANAAAMTLDDYEHIRRFLDANVRWTWCIKELAPMVIP
jgi:hypothetical protein